MKKSKSNKNFLIKFNSIPNEKIDQRISTETEIKSNRLNFLENLLDLIKISQSQFFNNIDEISHNFTIKSLIQLKNNLNNLFNSQKETKKIFEERKKNLIKKIEKNFNEKNYEIESLSNFNFSIFFDILCLNNKIKIIKNQIKNFKYFKINENLIENLNEIKNFDNELKNIEKDLNQELKDLKEFSEFQKIEINETKMKLNKMKEIIKKGTFRKKYINSEEIIDEEIENYFKSSNNFYLNSNNNYENTVNVNESSENNNFDFKEEENEIIENLENGEKIRNLNIKKLVNLNMNINVNINVNNNNNTKIKKKN